MELDKGGFGFSHDFTWDLMPKALRGIFEPAAIRQMILARPRRIIDCVVALFELGISRPVEGRSFADFPDAGLRSISMIEWGPNILVRVKAACWYVNDRGQPVIPLLQPRKAPLSIEKRAVYLALGRQAHCKGDWIAARTELIDLSSEGRNEVQAVVTSEDDLPHISDELLGEYVRTYVAAKKMADAVKVERPKKPKDRGMGDLFPPAE
ncbi:hypothetical protein [Novosphingobium sp. 9U]|uniref:hypothetical protein n=1 Tax=Novosphingobium sp. 9U TaxID=2653158 RepID=UPI0013597ED9|nr:hypothetical protein [Novosphingobium sp. 9U]